MVGDHVGIPHTVVFFLTYLLHVGWGVFEETQSALRWLTLPLGLGRGGDPQVTHEMWLVRKQKFWYIDRAGHRARPATSVKK
jgi:hypothetical protein